MSIDILQMPGVWKHVDGFPRPDWRLIREYIKDHYQESERPGIWHEASLQWVGAIREALGTEYNVRDSPNFIVLTTKSPASSKHILAVCEDVLRKIRHQLGSLAWRWKNGKHVVLMFEDLDFYYPYISYFYAEEGEFSASGGMFISRGYCHTAVAPSHDAVATLIHEFTHLSLAHLRIPLWLNEGFAMNTEEKVKGMRLRAMESELFASHDAHWNSRTIQDFWNGKSFKRPDESEMSYSLARILVANMQSDFRHLDAFVKEAKQSDAGEDSAQRHLGVSLCTIAATFLGDGAWAPDPAKIRQ